MEAETTSDRALHRVLVTVGQARHPGVGFHRAKRTTGRRLTSRKSLTPSGRDFLPCHGRSRYLRK